MTASPAPDPSRFPAALPVDALAWLSDDSVPDIEFTPVPRQRRRRRGWSPEAQRGFIAALSRCGSVTAAARFVGLTPRSAYALVDSEGADAFAAAWDQAMDYGMAALRDRSMARSIEGDYVPVYRRGRLVQVEHRHNDRLAIALLGGRTRSADDMRRSMVSRREHRHDHRQYDAAKAAHAAVVAAADAALRAEFDRIIARIEVNRRRRYPDG